MSDELEITMKNASPELRRKIIKAVAELVAQGKIEYTMVDGEPAVRIVEKKP